MWLHLPGQEKPQLSVGTRLTVRELEPKAETEEWLLTWLQGDGRGEKALTGGVYHVHHSPDKVI